MDEASRVNVKLDGPGRWWLEQLQAGQSYCEPETASQIALPLVRLALFFICKYHLLTMIHILVIPDSHRWQNPVI